MSTATDKSMAQLFQAAADIFELELHQISLELSQETHSDWDSMKMVELISEVEQMYDVQFSLLELTEFTSLGNVVRVLETKGIVLAE